MADKFKSGDRVRCIKTDVWRHRTVTPGDILVVDRPDQGTNRAFETSDGARWWDDRFELVTDEAPAADKALEWLKSSIQGFIDDPADDDFQNGYRGALEDMLSEVFSLKVETIPASVNFVAA